MGFKFAGTSLRNSAGKSLCNSHQRTHATDRRSLDDPSCTIVLLVRDPIPNGISHFLSVIERTFTTDRHTFDCPSYVTVITIRDPSLKGLHFFKCPTMDIDGGPS